MTLIETYQASAHDLPLDDESVHCVVTSPPYFGLRRYAGEQGVEWPAVEYAPMPGLPPLRIEPMECELGLETTPEAYIGHMVLVARELWRVLRDDGTFWLNIGDSYDSGTNASRKNGTGNVGRWNSDVGGYDVRVSVPGLKPKDLMLIPQRLALALQADGWYVRSDIIWAKGLSFCESYAGSCMPECLGPVTKVFIKEDGRTKQVTLDYIHNNGKPYPQILTPTGWQQIEHAWETYKDEAVEFEAAKVSEVKCSPEHLWPVSHDRRRHAIHEKQTKDLRDEGYNDYLLHYSIRQFLEPTIFEYEGQTLDYEFGWLLGIYAAEGGFGDARGYRCKFTVHADEKHLIDKIDAIASERFDANTSPRLIENYRDIRFADEQWMNIAESLVPGKVDTKSLNLDVILNAPEEFRQGIWDGYIDGDGSDRTVGTTATSASKQLRDDMCVLASSLDIVTSKKTNEDYDSRTDKTYISYQFWTPYLEHRKKKKGQNARQINVRNKQTVKGRHRMIDLQVKGGLFLIGDGLATHNSVRDRPTKGHEYLWLLTKQQRYFYDQDAVRERATQTTIERDKYPRKREYHNGNSDPSGGGFRGRGGFEGKWNSGGTRNLRTVWTQEDRDAFAKYCLQYGVDFYTLLEGFLYGQRDLKDVFTISPRGYTEAHYAVFPPALVEPCVKAGTSAHGVCATCGAPWERVVERKPMEIKRSTRGDKLGKFGRTAASGTMKKPPEYNHVGWQSTCSCDTDEVEPATVLDPFAGSGTTARVAVKLGRRAVLCDISQEYLDEHVPDRTTVQMELRGVGESPAE